MNVFSFPYFSVFGTVR